MSEEPKQIHQDDKELEQTVIRIKQVMEYSSQGNTTVQIAELLNLSQEYIYRIQVCAQGFREDDEIAVAHLVLMG